jgi:ABC-2 type transport system permease protein
VTILKVLTHLAAFVGKELIEVRRRPGALLSLIFGPFVIMLVFGLGYSGVRPPLTAALVIPPQWDLQVDVSKASELAPAGISIVGVVSTPEEGRALLESNVADMLVVAPPNPVAAFKSGKPSIITLEYDTVDPIKSSYAVVAADQIAAAVNREVIRQAVEQGQQVVGATSDLSAIPADVVAAPTRAQVQNLAPTEPRMISYFGPAVAALILQHMALTLVALALVRERTSGQIERYRISPVSAFEVILGKLLAYGLIVGVLAAGTLLLLVYGLQVPMLASGAAVAGVLALLILASTAIGLLIGAISGSESQAVQLSLLALLAAVFFGGLIVPIDQLSQPVATLALLIPVTHAVHLLQELMLNGSPQALGSVFALVAIAAGSLTAAWLLMRRSLAPA